MKAAESTRRAIEALSVSVHADSRIESDPEALEESQGSFDITCMPAFESERTSFANNLALLGDCLSSGRSIRHRH